MPHGSSHGSVNKETNSQPGGRDGSKTSVHMGPAAGGRLNANQGKGVFREPKGKMAPTASAKQYSK